ncbi:MAG TPA: L,D-transpeptidase [Polyangiaceae bacterium]|nr:L,D-transpeptidase [Polyangiaceae bacterium]
MLLGSARAAAEGQGEPAFLNAGAGQHLSSWQSVEILRDDEPLYQQPSSRAARRGAARVSAQLPLFGGQRGPGCEGLWLQVGPSAFVCESGVRLSKLAPLRASEREPSLTSGLPYRYFYVARDGSFGYRGLETAEEGVPDAQFQPGFALAITRVAQHPNGDPFGLTQRGFWVPLRDLSEAHAIEFRGADWSDELAWVTHEAAPVFAEVSRSSEAQRELRREPGVTLPRLTQLRVLERRAVGGTQYARIAQERWLLSAHVTQPRAAAPPEELRTGERWLDVDLSQQTLVAYAGTLPVFATLISSGRGREGSDTATPRGVHRVWVKLRTSDMSNLDDAKARENYALEAVPWVMFFEKGYGLHGTFWHSRFGEVRSHGCVNLTPRDAERLFHWTSPRLLPGWTAVFPTPYEPGTLVRVR